MSAQTLSSGQTFVVKFVFPPLWISGFGYGTFALWTGAAHGRHGMPPPPEMKYLFLAAWLIGTAFIWWLCAPLKRVRMDGRTLLVSNFRKEISIPISDIEDVTENRWINIHPVTIRLRNDTEFGDRITFMPTARMFGLWSSHPVVAQLRNIAATPISPSASKTK